MSLCVLNGLFQHASNDVSCDPEFSRNRQLCGHEKAIYHHSNVVSAIVRAMYI